jgi:acetyl-CoA C-acetyltransferase
MKNDSIVITGIARTPIGGFMGELAGVTAPALGAVAIAAAVERSGVKAEDVDAVNMGCVLPAGLGQAPARQAAMGAGLPSSVNCMTLNKMCGSGLQAVMLAHDALLTGSHDIIVAGGMESMSNAPHLLPKVRQGHRMGHGQMLDHMLHDGLEDVYEGKLMGVYAEATVEKYRFTREQQDAYALESLQRARVATENGGFAGEIALVTINRGGIETEIATDQHPFAVSLEKLPRLKPAFIANGTVTAASSSAIADGAAALVLMRADDATRRKLIPLARIVGHTSHSQAPEWFTTAPVAAINKLLDKTGWKIDEVDLFEINEAFAVVVMAAMHDLGLPHGKVNVHGGACALGHPVGASGARILVTLINAMYQRRLKRGIAAICIGGGEAVAVAVERI